MKKTVALFVIGLLAGPVTAGIVWLAGASGFVTHGGEDEFLYIESGTFKVRLGDKVMDAPAHSLVFVPRGTAHAFTNTGTEPGVVLVGITPGGFEKMFQERQGVDAKTNAELMKAHKMEIVGPKVQ